MVKVVNCTYLMVKVVNCTKYESMLSNMHVDIDTIDYVTCL